MNDSYRMFSKQGETSNFMTLEELKAKTAEAEKVLNRLFEEERRLQQEVREKETKPVFQNDNEPYLTYAKQKAEETVAFIKQNAEREIKDMTRKVKELKAYYDNEISILQERIDTKKRYIVTMFQSLMVFLDDGNGKHKTSDALGNVDNIKKESVASSENENSGADRELQSLLKQFM